MRIKTDTNQQKKNNTNIETVTIKCSLCDKDILNKESNNAEPINEGRCCYDCNLEIVVPTRISKLI